MTTWIQPVLGPRRSTRVRQAAAVLLLVAATVTSQPAAAQGAIDPARPVALATGSTTDPVRPAAIPVVSRNHLIDRRTDATFVPHGMNWPSFEYACAQGWGYSRDTATAATAAAIASWHANTVRLPLNQDCWLGAHGSPASGQSFTGTAAGYRAAVASFVQRLNAAGLVVILDLHSATTGGPNTAGQRAMPDSASITFWSQVAHTFATSPSVIFDAYNEPYSRAEAPWNFALTWAGWKSGGQQEPIEDDYTTTPSGTKLTTVGMADIVAAIRGAHAGQPIMLGGIDYANDLSQWLAHPPADSQLVASFHSYQFNRCQNPTCWNAEIAPVAAVVPVVTGEFGQTDGTADFMTTYMEWADSHAIGYLAWAWWVLPPNTSQNLALISNDDGTPRSPLGTAFKAHLATLPAQPTAAAGAFTALPPSRVVDTRMSSGAVAAGGVLSVQITGHDGVPSGAAAVVMNVTVTAPTAGGYLTAYPTGSTRPVTSNLDFSAQQTIADLVIIPIGPDGRINLYNGSGGRTQMIVDVAGYYHSGTPKSVGTFQSLLPNRLLDTRIGRGAGRGPIAPGGTVALQLSGGAASATAAVMTVTATAPTAGGYLTAFATARARTSNIDFVAGQTIPNLVTAPVAAGGTVRLYNGSSGSTHLLADIAGYYLGGHATVAGAYRPVGPTRVLDTRIRLGAGGAVPAGGTISVQITDLGGPDSIPAAGAAAVVLNLTAVNPTTVGYLTAFPAGSPRAGTSSLDFQAPRTIANLVVVPLGTGGKLNLFNGSGQSSSVVADVAGYFLSGG